MKYREKKTHLLTTLRRKPDSPTPAEECKGLTYSLYQISDFELHIRLLGLTTFAMCQSCDF